MKRLLFSVLSLTLLAFAAAPASAQCPKTKAAAVVAEKGCSKTKSECSTTVATTVADKGCSKAKPSCSASAATVAATTVAATT
ncbi:MAG: hypothetical protein ACI8Y8_004367, partial [Planctomycetota bacterium]